jgi:hypothetical protein
MGLAVIRIIMLLAWSMASAPWAFLSTSGRRHQSLRTPTLAPGIATLAGLLRLAGSKWTIDEVVCHSKYLIWKYRCHINVESIPSVKAIKYIYKYVYKGHDRITMEFGTCSDEIKQYLDACYVSSCEAHWRLYMFAMQEHHPTIVCLQVRLPNHQPVRFNPDAVGNMQDVVN